jgi:hypothetical protein
VEACDLCGSHPSSNQSSDAPGRVGSGAGGEVAALGVHPSSPSTNGRTRRLKLVSLAQIDFTVSLLCPSPKCASAGPPLENRWTA